MTFISPLFFLFLFIVISINYFLSPRYRVYLILISSFIFIGFYNIESLSVLLFFGLFNFFLAKIIKENRLLFILGIAINALSILMFNYFISSSDGLHVSFSLINFKLDKLLLALGLSFYALQNISYLIEIYFNRMQPEKEMSKYLLYISFFSKIISGPILFPQEFIPQIGKNSVTKEQVISGFQLLLFGLFKKMVIADRLATGVSSVFDFSSNYNGLTILAASYLFTIQLYFDFSGYTNIALGIARMLGYDLKDNFNFPLRSLSVTEFWRRWHISLISWFTKYIYYPLVFQFRYFKKTGPLIGIFITFFVSMIWHGIGFTFLAWALCHILFLSFETLTRKIRMKLTEQFNSKLYKVLCIFLVFNAVCFSNIFFRAPSFEVAIQLINQLFFNFTPPDLFINFINPLAVGGHQIDEFNFGISILLFTVFLLFERKLVAVVKSEKLNFKFIISILLLIMLFGVFNSGTRFIYMQF